MASGLADLNVSEMVAYGLSNNAARGIGKLRRVGK